METRRGDSGVFEYEEDGYVWLTDPDVSGHVVIPDGAKGIFEGGLSGCKGMTRVSIPVSMTSIYDRVFVDCPRLTRLCYRGTIAQWETMWRNPEWCAGSSLEIIHCTDGDIIL